MAEEIIIEEKASKLDKVKEIGKQIISHPLVHVAIGFVGGLIVKPAAAAAKQLFLETFAGDGEEPAEEVESEEMPF